MNTVNALLRGLEESQGGKEGPMTDSVTDKLFNEGYFSGHVQDQLSFPSFA